MPYDDRPGRRTVRRRLGPVVAPVVGSVRAMSEFLREGRLGGLALMAAALGALVWANSGLAHEYDALVGWVVPLPTPLPNHPLTLLLWVNDGLMAVFFLQVGLELRREITQGELASPARLAAPGLAALGGMVVPALIYIAINWADRGALRGWAVPVATDIAFALAVMGALGSRVPIGLKVFLTALAIIDDLGAILVIALFYTRGLDLVSLGAAAGVLLALWGLGRAGVRRLWPFLLGGLLLWALVFRSGIHATIAGVALAFVVPMDATQGQSPAARLEHGLGNWVAYLVLPAFGLANAGLSFEDLPSGAWRDTVALGTALGLLLGKQAGVFGAVLGAARLGWARLPDGVTRLQLYGAAVLCGIGFTMSLFISDLAFRNSARGDEVKLAVFAGSLAAAAWGLGVLWWAARGAGRPRLPEPVPVSVPG